MPMHKNITDIKKKPNKCFLLEGITYGRLEQIIIAAGNYEYKKKRNQVKGLIIHEFCHFAVYETFCNDYNAYFENDKEYKTQWLDVINECSSNKEKENLIQEVFNYVEEQWPRELVVRYFQYQIQFQFEPRKLENFKSKFPLLCKICETYVYQTFVKEYVKINAVREINKITTKNLILSNEKVRDDTGLKLDLECDVQIIKSAHSKLIVNYIFHKFKKSENFQSKFVFLTVPFLIDSVNYQKFKSAMQRKVRTTFVIDCDNDVFSQIELKLKVELENFINCNVILLLGKNGKNQIIEHFKSHFYDFTPKDLSEELINAIRVKFQQREISLADLMEVKDFRYFHFMPNNIYDDDKILLGNQVDPELCEYYVDRRFLMQSQNGWVKFENIDDVLDNHQKILIANEPGAGKSIESVHMYHRFKIKYPKHWIVNINLSTIFDILNNDAFQFSMETFCFQILKFCEFEKELFEYLMEKDKVIFIFDSLDEIAPKYLGKTKKLFKMIFKKHQRQRMVIFSRPHLVEQMEEFTLRILKMENIEDISKVKMIQNFLKQKDLKNYSEMQNKIHSFLEKNDLHTPLLIKMVIVVSSLPSFDPKVFTIYDIYHKFLKMFRKTADEKNIYVEVENFEVSDINKHLQKHALEELVSHQDDSIYSFQMKKPTLLEFINFHLDEKKLPDPETLQRIGVLHFNSDKKLTFIHASFNDFYIAQFIEDHIKYFPYIENHTNAFLNILKMLLCGGRLKSVFRFLEHSEKVAENLKDLEVLHRLLTKSKKNNESDVNIYPIIRYLMTVITNHPNLRKMCMENRLSLQQIQFSDPMKTLNDIYCFKKKSWKSLNAWEKYINEHILMNKRNIAINLSYVKVKLKIKHDNIESHIKKEDSFSMNIIDALAQCGEKGELIEFLVSKETFEEYFRLLTYDRFTDENIIGLFNPFLRNKQDYRSSFFLMSQNSNRAVIETFIDFYEKKLLDIKIFSTPLFASYNAILILNSKIDCSKRIIQNLNNVANLNHVSLLDLVYPPNFERKNWLEIIADYIESSHVSPDIDIEKAIDFLFSILNGENLFKMLKQKNKRGFSNLYRLLSFQNFKIIESVLYNILKHIPEKSSEILEARNFSKLTATQMIATRLSTVKENNNKLLQTFYSIIDNEKFSQIQKSFIEPEFINVFIDQIFSTNALNIDEIVQVNILNTVELILNNLSSSNKKAIFSQNNQGNTILTAISYLNNDDLMHKVIILLSKYLDTELLNLFTKNNSNNDSFLSMLNYDSNNSGIKESVLKILKMQTDLNMNCIKAIYEIFCNKMLSENQLYELLRDIQVEMVKKNNVKNIFCFANPVDKSSILIAAAKCQKQGRVRSFLKVFENFLETELFEMNVLNTDLRGINALSYLLVNEFQDEDFLLLFEKIEKNKSVALETMNQIVLDLMLSSKLDSDEENVIFNIVKMNRNGIKKGSIFKMIDYLKPSEKRLIISSMNETILTKFIKISSQISMFTVEKTLNYLFHNDCLYEDMVKKIEDSSFENEKNGNFVNLKELSSAFQSYRTSKHRIINMVEVFLNRSYSSSWEKRLFSELLFENHEEIKQKIQSLENYLSRQKESDGLEKKFRNFWLTFIYLIKNNTDRNLIENITKQNKIQLRNYETIFEILEYILKDTKKIECLMKKRIVNDLSVFKLCLKYCSSDFQYITFENLKKNIGDIEKYQIYLKKELDSHTFQENILHVMLKKRPVDFTSLMHSFEKIKEELKNPEVIKNLCFHNNYENKTPLACGLANSEIKPEECLDFFTLILDHESMKSLIEKELEHNMDAFRSLLERSEDLTRFTELFGKYFEKPIISQLLLITGKQNEHNIIHDLFSCRNFSGCVAFMKLSKCFENVDCLKLLMTTKDKNKRTPLRIASESYSDSFIKYLETVETVFQNDQKFIKSLLIESNDVQNEKPRFLILYQSLHHGTFESKKFSVEFHRKYFEYNEFKEMIRVVFETVDKSHNNLLHIIGASKKYDEACFYLLCDVLKQNIQDSSMLMPIFTHRNIGGETPILKIAKLRDVSDDLTILANEYLSDDIISEILRKRDRKKESIKSITKKKSLHELQRIEKLYQRYCSGSSSYWTFDIFTKLF